MNWFLSTGTLQFQGKDADRDSLEAKVTKILYPSAALGPAVKFDISGYERNIPAKPQATSESKNNTLKYLEGEFNESEFFVGIVSAVGTESALVITPMKEMIEQYGYKVHEVRVSDFLDGTPKKPEYDRINGLMKAGDDLRKRSKRNSILAAGVAKKIKSLRSTEHPKTAYIINSLKHPDEVHLLRKIYGDAFYLIGIHADKLRRHSYLTRNKGVSGDLASKLMITDEAEDEPHGQKTRDTYHLSDFFVNLGKNTDHVKNTLERFLELMFAQPYQNPTFDEYAMFMAFCSSISSGDLSRQVGAVISKNYQILATGANECPTFGGGHYWAELDTKTSKVIDRPDGKDYTWKIDSNKEEQKEIIQEILEKAQNTQGITIEDPSKLLELLKNSRISDLTEFGRIVHAEMNAVLSCARAGIATYGATMYCTTFPCHNCAKHLVDAGLLRVVYVEPYPKSKALDLHDDSIELKTEIETALEQKQTKVIFEPFTGVGARRFLDLFSMNLGAGAKLKRKDENGNVIPWTRSSAKLRIPTLPEFYLSTENEAATFFNSIVT